MFKLHDCRSPHFWWPSCILSLSWLCTGVDHVTCTYTHHVFLDAQLFTFQRFTVCCRTWFRFRLVSFCTLVVDAMLDAVQINNSPIGWLGTSKPLFSRPQPVWSAQQSHGITVDVGHQINSATAFKWVQANSEICADTFTQMGSQDY